MKTTPPPTLPTPNPSTANSIAQVPLGGGASLTWVAEPTRPTFRVLVRVTPRRGALSTGDQANLHLLMGLLRENLEGATPLKEQGLHDLPIRVQAVWDGVSLVVHLEGTTQHAELSLVRLLDGIVRPVLSAEALERLRGKLRIMPTPALERLAADLAVRAGSQCLSALPLPTEQQLDQLRLQDLQTLHHRVLGPSSVEVFGLGDLDAKPLSDLLTRALSAWGADAPAAPTVPAAMEVCGRLWVCGDTSEIPEIRLGFCLRGGQGLNPAATHLLPFLFRRLGQSSALLHEDTLDPSTGYCRLVTKVPQGVAPHAHLEVLEAWLKELAHRPLPEVEIQTAKRAWQAWRRTLPLRPAERLAWLASGLYPDEAMAARVEALTVADVTAAWVSRLSPQGRQTLVLGGEAGALQKRTGAGHPAPELIQVAR